MAQYDFCVKYRGQDTSDLLAAFDVWDWYIYERVDVPSAGEQKDIRSRHLYATTSAVPWQLQHS
jgi:hypothetical protein